MRPLFLDFNGLKYKKNISKLLDYIDLYKENLYVRILFFFI